MTANAANILLIEDNSELSVVLQERLSESGFKVQPVPTLARARAEILGASYDLAIIDRNLPDGDGLDICRHIRENHPQIATIILTCLGEPRDRVTGLNEGADDYISKPFCLEEVIARINTVLRRVAPRVASPKNTTIVRGDITIDVGRRAVKLNESPVPLTATEFDLLLLLAQNPGRTFTRDELVTTLWGAVRASSSGSLGVHMAHLRAKLNDDTTKPRYIITVWGVGYYFDGNV